MTRFALAGISHETNTFAPIPSGLADFVSAGVLRGDEIVRDHRDAHTAVAGMLSAQNPATEIVPLLYAALTPSGLVEDDAFEALVGELLATLADRGPWDGVLLALHGAMVSSSHPDADGELLRRVRAVVGDKVPVGCTLDLHANVSQRMVDNADILVGYLTNPHVDTRERGRECAELLQLAATGGCRPEAAFVGVPAVLSILRQGTDDEPMRALVTAVEHLRRDDGVLSASVFEGYPWADVPEMGMSVVVVTDGDRDRAERLAGDLADQVWAARPEFRGRGVSVEEAFDLVGSAAAGPVVLLDVGDNVGAGGTGDSTVLLHEAVVRDCPLVVTLHDPPAVELCVNAGVGARLSLEVGGRHPGSPAPPVRLDAVVHTLSDGRFEEPNPTHGGLRYFDAGRTAVLGTAAGQLVVVTEQRVLPTSARQLTSVGIDPTAQRALVAKGVFSPLAGYRPIARSVVFADTPGLTTADLGSLPYRHRRSPLYPLDDDRPTGRSRG